MKQIVNLIGEECASFFRNATLRSVFFLGPIFYALLLGSVYKKGKVDNVPVIVFDQDRTPLSFQLTEMLEDNRTISPISCDEGGTTIKDEMIKKEAAAAIIIPSGFESDILQKRYPEVNVYINTANILTANFASKAIQTCLGTLSAGVEIKSLQKKGMTEKDAKNQYETFKANYITLFNTANNYLIFMWPPLMGVVLQQVILLAMAISFSARFERNTFTKTFGEKPNSLLVILVKVLPIWIFSAVNIMMFYIMHKLFKIPLPENELDFVILSAAFVSGVSFLGIFVSILVQNALKATQILMIIASPAFIISGFTWPLDAMPRAIQYLANIIPLTPFLRAFKILLIQKGNINLIMPDLQHLSILLLVYFTLGWITLKLKIRELLRTGISDAEG